MLHNTTWEVRGGNLEFATKRGFAIGSAKITHTEVPARSNNKLYAKPMQLTTPLTPTLEIDIKGMQIRCQLMTRYR